MQRLCGDRAATLVQCLGGDRAAVYVLHVIWMLEVPGCHGCGCSRVVQLQVAGQHS